MLKRALLACLCLLLIANCFAGVIETVVSPDGNIRFLIHSEDKKFRYSMEYKSRQVIKNSKLGFVFKEPNLKLEQFEVIGTEQRKVDESWQPVWGETKFIRNNYNQLFLRLRTEKGIMIDLIVRVFNDGAGFRYSFPKQEGLNHFVIADELTEFEMAGDHKVFWIPGDYDTNEFSYYTTKLSEIDASSSAKSQEIYAKTYFSSTAVQTPLMMKTNDGLYINIHEAALVNYPAMNLVLDKSKNAFTAHLVPDAFQFIKDVAVDWDDTRVLEAEPGDYVITARKAKGKESWFLGAMTDEEARNFTVQLSFLTPGKKYTATVYRDADDAHWQNNPEAYKIEKFTVDNKSSLLLKLAPGGGTAVSFIPQ